MILLNVTRTVGEEEAFLYFLELLNDGLSFTEVSLTKTPLSQN